MAFTVDDFHDLVRLLQARPDWKQDLRRLVLTDELLDLPGIVRDLAAAQQRTEAQLQELAAAQKRTDEQLAILTARVDALADQVTALTARVDALADQVTALTARVDALADQVTALTARVDALADQVTALTARVDALAVAQQRTEVRLGKMVGDLLEARFRDRAAAWLGRLGLRRARVVPDPEWAEQLDEAVDTGRLTEADRAELLLTDAVVRARDADGEVWLAVEVSATVDAHDVERAQRRAALLARLEGRVRGAVAGQAFTAGAEAALAADPAVVKIPVPGGDN
ncbi:MAG: hypothetical protein K6V97_08895 [Actinomycetia bacterium]|nr:hypothetical protein [Actinomycetes bacterium]